MPLFRGRASPITKSKRPNKKKKINNNIRMYMRLCVHVATSRERIPRGKPSLKRNEITTVDLQLLVWAQNWIGATSVREQFVWMRRNNVRFFASRLGDKLIINLLGSCASDLERNEWEKWRPIVMCGPQNKIQLLTRCLLHSNFLLFGILHLGGFVKKTKIVSNGAY